jgi:ethanolamine ammonia-lyase small subunit
MSEIEKREPDSELVRLVREQTPARILEGRAGVGYRTATHLTLRVDHAAARDAVLAEVDLADLAECGDLFEVRTLATSKQEYLLRPDLGRQLDAEARRTLVEKCPRGATIQVVVGDGLSAAAVRAQVPAVLERLHRLTLARGYFWGRPFFVRYCRVGVLNDVGELLDPEVVVLLIGERPGLATAESLSAYMAYKPRKEHKDAQRNLISNIHARGVSHDEAAARILALAEQMRQQKTSGVAVKEVREGPDDRVPAAIDPSHPDG